MDVIFRRLLDTNFSDLSGLTVDATIPVPERLVNEILEAALLENKSITSCQVSIGSQNRVALNLKTTLWPWPFYLKLKLFRTVDLSGSPKIRAFLENHLLLGKLGALLNALPDGVTVYKDQVSVDIGPLLKMPEQKQLISLIHSAEIDTEDHRILLHLHMRK